MTVSTATAFTRSNLREQIKDVILQRIVEGTLEPGSRIVETPWPRAGVSQGPCARRRAISNSWVAWFTSPTGLLVRAFRSRSCWRRFGAGGAGALRPVWPPSGSRRPSWPSSGAARAQGRGRSRRCPRSVAGQRLLPCDDRARRAQRDARAPMADAEPYSRAYLTVSRPGSTSSTCPTAPPISSSRAPRPTAPRTRCTSTSWRGRPVEEDQN